MRQVHVGDALAIAEFQRFEFALGQDLGKFVALHGGELAADVGVAAAKRGAMRVGDGEEPLEIFLRIRPAADREKVDELDEQAGMALARLAAPPRPVSSGRE